MKRNVILLSNAYWPSIGGIENSLRHLSIEAKHAGDNVEIIVSDIAVPATDTNRFATVIDDVKVSRYPISPFTNALLKPFNIIASSWHLYRLLKKTYIEQPNAIVVARFHFGAVAANLAGFRHVRYLVPSIVANQYRDERKVGASTLSKIKRLAFIALHSIVQKKALKHCQNFVFSETMRQQCMLLAKNKANDYFLTKPGVDQSRFCVCVEKDRMLLRRKLFLPEDKKIILFVGRFVKAKGVDLLIDTMKSLTQNCYLVLVGGGDERDTFIAHITAIGLMKQVTIVDPLRTVEDYYRCADVFVMSSRYEPLGQTLLEAFSSGLTVAAFSRVAGVDTATEELAMHEFVSYASELSASSLANEISAQLDSVSEEKRIQVSQAAKLKFSWAKLYTDLIS
jgi:glycosyltransferase involved in cell wall biosynthesis